MRKVEYLTCLLAGVAVLFSFRQANFPAAALPTVDTAAVTADAADAADGVTLTKTAHGGADYLAKIVFIGDSRTYGLRHFAMLEGGTATAQVWTPLCGTMSVWDMQNQKIYLPDTGAEMTCAEAAALRRPEILLISLGFNGFEMVERDYFADEYAKLIAALQNSSPESVIILQSMFPVCRSYADTRITNAAIRDGNEIIRDVARKAGVFYLDTAEALCDAEGYLPEAYASDGCHLTPLGLDAELNYICTHQIPEVKK